MKEPFFKLMNLEKKYARYTNHQNYLKECETRNVISKGFILRKSANIGHVSMSFKNDWDEILIFLTLIFVCLLGKQVALFLLAI